MDSKFLLAVFAVVIVASFGYICFEDSDDNDAADKMDGGSSSAPLSSLTIESSDNPLSYSDVTFYVKKGGSVSIYMMNSQLIHCIDAAVTSGYGLSVSGEREIYGTLSKAGNITVTFSIDSQIGSYSGSYSFKIVSVDSTATASYTCYLYFKANGGSGSVPATQQYTGSSTSSHRFTIPSCSLTRSGYEFLGWSTSSTATSATYEAGDTISVSYNGSKTLYAVWKQEFVFTVTPGSAGSTITLTANLSNVLWGISTNSSKASLSTTQGSSVVVTPSNYGYIKVSASVPNSTYSDEITLNICCLVYNKNGGTGTVPATEYWIQSGSSSHSFSLASASFTKSSTSSTSDGTTTTTSYSHIGWGSSSSATSTISSKSVSYRSTATVYACFSKTTTTSYFAPSVTLGSAGSTMTLTASFSNVTWKITTNASKAALSATSGTSVTLTPSAYGTVKVTCYNASDTTKSVTKTLYISSLVYNANGGSNAPATQYYVTSSASSHTFTLSGTPTHSSAEFAGWGNSSTATSSITSISVSYGSTATVYAIWTIPEDTLTFTSVPTYLNVTLPTVVYDDDGTYTIII